MHPPTWEQATSLVQALTGFAWPTAAILVAVLFRTNLGNLIDRIRFLRIFGNDLSADIESLDRKVEQIERQTPKGVKPEAVQDLDVPEIEPGAPLADLVLVAVAIEREMRAIHQARGLPAQRYTTARQLIRDLVKAEVLTEDMPAAIDDFWAIRNRALHGESIAEPTIRQAVSLGRRILRVLERQSAGSSAPDGA